MNFWNNPEYSQFKILVLIAIVAVGGWAVYNFAGKSDSSLVGDVGMITNNIKVKLISTNTIATIGPDANDDTGTFEIVFSVKAIGDDAYISQALSYVTPIQDTVRHIIAMEKDGVTLEHWQTGIVAFTLTSSAEMDGPTNFVVYEGDTETFTVTVEKHNGEAYPAGNVSLILKNIKWNNTNSIDTYSIKALDKTIFRTDSLYLN